MANAVVLFSGGLDSSTVLAVAKSQGWAVYALTIAYGQRHKVEVEAAERVCKTVGVVEHTTLEIRLDSIAESALTGHGEIPKDGSSSGIPTTYVPARNTIFLSLAMAYAETVQAEGIFIGVSSVDYSGYPDCRPAFIEAFENLARVATKSGVEGRPLKIIAPLIRLSKADTIRLGLSLGVDYGLTHSCYDPDEHGRPCQKCDSCRIRMRGFAELGLDDPLLVRP
jgi:7-cyano-7-deazaguanine synthase